MLTLTLLSEHFKLSGVVDLVSGFKNVWLGGGVTNSGGGTTPLGIGVGNHSLGVLPSPYMGISEYIRSVSSCVKI